MEEEKKKKKNKKKKNKQTKTTEAVSVGTGESASTDQVNRFEQNHQSQVSNTADIPNDMQKMDVDLDRHNTDRHNTNGTQGVSLEEKFKQLQKEKDAFIKKEADLGLEISQLQNEKEIWFQKEAGYREKINQLVDEASTTSLKGVGLEEKITQLEAERGSWLQKEVMELEDSRNNLVQENRQLIENISGLQSEIQNLQKIMASAHLSTENTMRASGNEDMNSEMLAAQALVEKLLSENAELVEKVNGLNVELDRRGTTAEPSSSVESDPTVDTVESAHGAEGSALVSDRTGGTAERLASAPVVESSAPGPDQMAGTADQRPQGATIADPMFESSERTAVLGEKMKPMENVGSHSEKDVGNYVNHEDTAVIPNSEIIVCGEIEQIPLTENEVGVTKLESEASHDDKTDVPISDAPLIGAPFRLLSFVGRYVSGADLVIKSSVHSGR